MTLRHDAIVVSDYGATLWQQTESRVAADRRALAQQVAARYMGVTIQTICLDEDSIAHKERFRSHVLTLCGPDVDFYLHGTSTFSFDWVFVNPEQAALVKLSWSDL